MASHAIHSVFKGVAEYFTPVLQSSNFKKKGVLTPEEFVEAGDQLVYKCRTWHWAPGKENCLKPYLPKDKQYLITRNVPSLKRATDYALNDAKEQVVENDDGKDADGGWVETHVKSDTKKDIGDDKKSEEAVDLDFETVPNKQNNGVGGEEKSNINKDGKVVEKADQENGGAEEDEDDIPDMDEFEEDNLVEPDPGMLLTNNIIENGGTTSKDQKNKTVGPSGPNISNGGILRVSEPPEDNIERTRTYDISITYDKYYRTPRIFLFGYV